jgi:hypothetical protein
LQLPDNSQHFCGHVEERRYNLLALERGALAKGYKEGDLSVICELRARLNGLPEGAVGRHDQNIGKHPSPIYILQFHAHNPGDGEHWDQEMVFVVNVKGMKGENIAVPSSIWFYSLNHEVEESRCRAYASCHGKVRYDFFPRIGDREFGSGGVKPFGTQSAYCILPSKIQSAMEVVDCIANHERNIRAEGPIKKNVVEELFPRLAIDVHGGAVAVGRCAESLLDIGDVLIGPFDL